jgi:nucleoside-diphosphate-sugar epimerase
VIASSIVVGAGWLGTAAAPRLHASSVARRDFHPDRILPGSAVVVASGRAVVAQGDRLGAALATELAHLRTVLDACESMGAKRVVVLGSSDVAGVAAEIRGTTPQDPLTNYAQVKAALEDECVLRAQAGMPVTCVRLAPVHGPGKAKTVSLIRLSRRPVVPLPGGGHHSVGFVLLDDALRAIEWLAEHPAPAVVAVGGGWTPLRDLLRHLGRAQGARAKFVPMPAPRAALRRLAPSPLPEPLNWLVRLSLPRAVEMEVPVPVTPLADAAAMLVTTC